MFLLVPAYPGCPGSKAIKRSLLLLRPYSGFKDFPGPGKIGTFFKDFQGSVATLHLPGEVTDWKVDDLARTCGVLFRSHTAAAVASNWHRFTGPSVFFMSLV